MTPHGKFIGTSNHGFARYAQEEIRRLFPGASFSFLVAEEVYAIDLPFAREQVIPRLLENEPVFLRHIQPVDERVAINRSENDLPLFASFAEKFAFIRRGEQVAVQARKIGGVPFAYTPYSVKAAVDEALLSKGAEPVIGGAHKIVSIFLDTDTAYCGVSTPQENLSDWPGGAMRFQKEEGQVSRAKFKLLEAEKKFGLDFTLFSRALDVGAAPGGWTSLLLERGLEVVAVDPAAMHPSLLTNLRLTHLRQNAADVRFREERFDLLVCDMSWEPRQMVRLIGSLAGALRSGGTAVITLKLLRGQPFRTLKETVKELQSVLVLQQAKQLFHNREEITLYFKKK